MMGLERLRILNSTSTCEDYVECGSSTDLGRTVPDEVVKYDRLRCPTIYQTT